MKRHTRWLSWLLLVAMIASLGLTSAFAEEGTEEEIIQTVETTPEPAPDPTEVTVATEVPETTEVTEATEVPEPTEAPEVTETVEEAEEPVLAEEAEMAAVPETQPEEPAAEEEEPAEPEEAVETNAITAQPEAVTAAAGAEAKFSVGVTGEVKSCQWQYSKNGKTWYNLSAKTYGSAQELAFVVDKYDNNYQFRVIVTFADGEKITSDPAVLTVVNPYISSQPESVTVAPGGTAEFTVGVEGSVSYVRWQVSKNSGKTWSYLSTWTYGMSETLSYKAVESADGYLFRAYVVCWDGTKLTSAPAKLTVAEPEPTFDKPLVVEEKLDGDEEITVAIDAPAEALPDGTVAEIELVELTEAQKKAVAAKADGEILFAADIAFQYNGEEIEPAEGTEVGVSFQADSLAGKEVKVVHLDDEDVAKIMEQEGTSAQNKVAFKSDAFSVYVVVDPGDTGDNARVQVNFYNGSTKLASMYVKNSDTLEQLETILYDPGAGTIPAGQVFVGWTKNPDYTADDVDSALTIADVREEMEAMQITQHDPIDQVNYYAMILSVYTVTYLDEVGVVVRSDTLYTKNGAAYTGYKVDEPYTPSDQDSNFEGWYLLDADGNPTGDPIELNSEITVTASIRLKAAVPKGHWLIFKENGSGASYTGPQFIKGNGKGTEPDDPTRLGYTFGGWYTNAECTGDEFNFDTPITERTTLYAKWTAVATANYTVLIWKQKVTGGTTAADYDFAEAITLSGTTNTTVSTVTSSGSGDNRYASVNGTAKRYTGFHLDNYNTNVTIKPEGNAVVNVYYNRNEYTLTFRRERNGTVYKTITALYQQPIGGNFPITDNGANAEWRWDPQSSSTFNQVLVYIDIMPAESVTFYRSTSNADTKYMEFYVEVLPGQTGTRTFNGKSFVKYGNTITAKYNFFTEAEDFLEFTGYNKYGSDPAFSNGRANVSSGGTIRFYYTRKAYPINFMDGAYYNGNGNQITSVETRGQLHEVDDISYGANLSSYNKDGTDYYTPTAPAGYVFEGWYIDSLCTQPYTFTTMPDGGITVYAKWRQIQYRVFLHPMVTEAEDDSLDMGGQATSFRVSYDDQINSGNVIQATRDEYDLIGWYTDEARTQAFNFAAFVLNDTTVTTKYDQTDNTELTTPYATVEEEGNADAANSRFWITHKLDLYAKWRAKLIGANGITIEYVADGYADSVDPATGEAIRVEVDGKHADDSEIWTDPVGYQDSSSAYAAAASAPTDDESGYVFKYWVLYDGSTGDYVATDTHILPGEEFDVLKSLTKVEDLPEEEQTPGVTKKYTIRLVAEYGAPEDDTPTHIFWFANNNEAVNYTRDQQTGEIISGATAKNVVEKYDIQINEAVDIPTADTFSYPGHIFLGWARLEGGEGKTPAEGATVNKTTTELFLKWVPASGEGADAVEAHYEAQVNGKWQKVTQVAADEKNPYQDLYAVWAEVFYIYHERTDGTYEFTTHLLTDDVLPRWQYTTKYDKTSTNDGYTDWYYGGYYKLGNVYVTDTDSDDYIPTGKITFTGTGADKGTGFDYDWSRSNAAKNENAFQPVGGDVYFIKEVASYYLPTPKIAQVNHYEFEYGDKEITNLFLLSVTDTSIYRRGGVIITPDGGEAITKGGAFALTYEATQNATGTTDKITGADFQDCDTRLSDTDYLTVADGNDILKQGAGTYELQPFWLTADQVTVKGLNSHIRTVTLNEAKDEITDAE